MEFEEFVNNAIEKLLLTVDKDRLSHIKSELNNIIGEDNYEITSEYKNIKENLEYKYSYKYSDYCERLTEADLQNKLHELEKDIIKYIKREQIPFIVTIKFNEFIITNASKECHTIKDLFVRFYLSYDLTIKQNENSYCLAGARTTLTDKEAVIFYRHSHLSRDRGLKFSGFCTGSGTPLAMFLKIVLTEPNWEYEDFTMFLNCLVDYIKWESKEGGPYEYISEIKYSSKLAYYDTEYNVGFFKSNFFDRTKLNKYFKLTFTKTDIVVEPTSLLEEHLVNYLLDKLKNKLEDKDYISHFICAKHNFIYVNPFKKEKYNEKVLNYLDNPYCIVNFKGQEYFLNIIKTEEDDTKNIKYYPHPKITSWYKDKFESWIKKRLYEESGTRLFQENSTEAIS